MMMHNFFCRLPICLAVSAILVGSTPLDAVVFAEPADMTGSTAMVFGKSANTFQFDYTDGDPLFDFRGAMPGDTMSQTITVKNTYKERVQIYFRVGGTDVSKFNEPNMYRSDLATPQARKAMSDDLVQKLRLTILQDGRLFYSGPLSGRLNSAVGEAALLSDILLAQLKAGESQTLQIAITVPSELTNEYHDAVIKVDWLFRAFTDEEASRPGGGSGGGGYLKPDSGDDGDNNDNRDLSPPLVNIGDDPVPLANPLFTIPDEKLPLGNLPKTGGALFLPIFCGELALAVGIFRGWEKRYRK